MTNKHGIGAAWVAGQHATVAVLAAREGHNAGCGIVTGDACSCEKTWSQVWYPLLGGREVMESGMGYEAACAGLKALPPLPALGGRYAVEPDDAE